MVNQDVALNFNKNTLPVLHAVFKLQHGRLAIHRF